MIMKDKKKNKHQRDVTLDGMLTIGKCENNLRRAEFECCEDVEVEAFVGRFKVQGMRDGSLYMEEMPRRIRNKPLFRQDNSSLTLGRNGLYYFVFTCAEGEMASLPELLMKEARETAAKVIRMVLEGANGGKE